MINGGIKKGKYFFYIIVVVVTMLIITLFKFYFSSIFLAIVFAISFQPVYRYLHKKLGIPKVLSTISIILMFVAAVLVPLIFFFMSLFGEINNLLIKFQIESFEQAASEILVLVNSFYNSYPLLAQYRISDQVITENIQHFLSTYNDILFNRALTIGSSSLFFAAKLLVFFILIFFLTPNLKKIEKNTISLSPMGYKVTKIYVKRIRGFISTFVLYCIPISVVQGLLGGVILLIFRVPNTLLYTSLMILLSIVPVLGPGFVLVPVSLFYILSGNLVAGLSILLWYIIVISNVDNILRTVFVSKKVEINPVALFISFLAGLQIFGLMGIFYGPLIVVLFFTTLEIYNKYYK